MHTLLHSEQCAATSSVDNRLIHFFKPSKVVPLTPWTASSRWSLNPTRLAILIFGLTIFGFGEALLIQSTLGNSPWAVLSQGLSKHSPLSLGWSTFFISLVVLLLWIPLKQWPGFGTVANIIVIAFALQIGTDWFPIQHHNFTLRFLYVVAGIAIIGLGSSLYITCGLGPGPRDGLMTGLHRTTGVRVGRVRLTLELIVMSVGWLLGGRVGLGTLMFALFIGNAFAIALNIVRKLTWA
jgi:uncharacterized membrane protein YczE